MAYLAQRTQRRVDSAPLFQARGKMADDRLRFLAELERKVLWLASWTVHNANHRRESYDGIKVGGHQASSASLATILTALYFAVLKPEDPASR